MSNIKTEKDKLVEQIKQVLVLYDLGVFKTHFQLSFGYANQNYRIDTDQGSFLYRVCTQQPLSLIEYEVTLMKALRQIAFPTAYPIAKKDGGFIHSLDEHYVMVYEFYEGHEPALNAYTCSAIAEAIGKLSLLPNAQHYLKKNAIHLDTCDALIAEFEQAKNPIPVLLEYFKEQTNYLRPLLRQPLPKGVVHGDCFADNTLFGGNQLVAVIDFEEACHDHLLFDVGVTINGFCFPDNQLDAVLLEAFLTAYQHQRSLTHEEWTLLFAYIQWGAHGMITWHLRNNLLHKHHQSQWQRVQELMHRVQQMRQEETQINQLITQIAKRLKNATNR
ncbi:homoserine kinase [uncultured Microscilla sp.]|uniref:homoserine kinase n=1 Tax=uncultured Microscilla sp. TaxID=432653 RepID=UPI002615439B|nr:homoserine kinase [uncultured Microscilla sp.]